MSDLFQYRHLGVECCPIGIVQSDHFDSEGFLRFVVFDSHYPGEGTSTNESLDLVLLSDSCVKLCLVKLYFPFLPVLRFLFNLWRVKSCKLDYLWIKFV